MIQYACLNHYYGIHMTMHLVHPSLTTMGKRKGKRKFRNADEARKARELKESWEQLQKKWNSEPKAKKSNKNSPVTTLIRSDVYRRDTGPAIKSLNGGKNMSPATKAPDKVYTGTKIIGIGTMHKSNAVPIFSDEEAQDIARMRRG